MATNSQWLADSPNLASTHRVLATSTLKGSRIFNFAGEELGKVDDLVVDLDSGRLSYVVVSLGGFLGIRDKLFAVPWDLFSARPGDHQFYLDMDKQMLLDGPSFERSRWPDMSDAGWAAEIHSHYAQKPYWNSEITDASQYVGAPADDDF